MDEFSLYQWLVLGLLGMQAILLLVLIVIARRCHHTLVGNRNAIKSLRSILDDPDGRMGLWLQAIHKQLRDIEYHTRKPPSKIEDIRDVLGATIPPEDSE